MRCFSGWSRVFREGYGVKVALHSCIFVSRRRASIASGCEICTPLGLCDSPV